ncbi:MAG: DUF421 domain-containing protein [Clostridia bacterium]|nr:DUF421 domain-containing protein [Clostridia bacterium]
MGLSFVRTIILYIAVITAMRTMGKRTIGEMNPTELVVSIMISDLASVPMQSKSTPLFDGIVPIFTLVVLELVFAFLIMKSRTIKRILVGRSCSVVKNGNLLENEMARLRITVDDLEEQARLAGYDSLASVSEIIIETNGKASIVPKEQNRPVEIGDLKIESEQTKIPFLVIVDGKLREKDLKNAGVDMNFVSETLRKNSIGSIKDVMYMSVSDGKTVMIKRKKKDGGKGA